ncbi:DUF4394 domain-containing protein [Hymenobacter sp. BT491]|uniref:DUF4394 domain-containing protein n=1 Tax=Hymenobacter sp. BT491 TaxID=2766779 RepID=UPI00165357AD|nr:DUF4394 domain-containing protein [Hymenobacter sp. BT491]MBC6992251.1 DUF4394 domain-containing protein [Hymenobacter sp. BT491]
MLPFPSRTWRGAALLLLASLSGCQDLLEQVFPAPAPTPAYPTLGQAISFFAVSRAGTLDAYSTQAPNTRTASVALTGLQSGERLLALDFRPATGQLYGLGSTSRLYLLNPTTGAAHALGSGAFSPALAGTVAGFDFNPSADRIRVVTGTGQNLLVHPDDGTFVEEGRVEPSSVRLSAVAYSNSWADATSTTLYAVGGESTGNTLYRLDAPATGLLTPIDPLDFSGLPLPPTTSSIPNQVYAMDIGGTSNRAYAISRFSGLSDYVVSTVNLQTGTLSFARLLTWPPSEPTEIIAVAVGPGF